MSASVLCQGCGGRVAIPDDYGRARIRCPECGVMGDVPEAARKAPAAGGADKPRRPPPAETEAAVEEALFGDGAAAAEPAPEERPARREQAVQARPAAPRHPLPPSPNENASDADDGRPYRVPGIDDERPCPECQYTIPSDAVLCTRCGYNLETGRKEVQRFEPVRRDWQGGWPARVRLGAFLAGEALFLTGAVAGVVFGEAPVFGVFFPWLLFTAMSAFLLGTYVHIRLARNKKGSVRITKTWTVCFFPRPPEEVDVLEYGGVVCGPYDESSIVEWVVLIVLLVAGVIPGILWFYFVFIRMSFQVTLSKQHGHAELVLYRGGSQEMAVDITEAVRNAARLPCEKN